MNRQGFPHVRLSSLHMQQGLFASLSLVVTLIGGQQFARFEQAQEPVSTVEYQAAPQQHFSAIEANAAVGRTGGYELVQADDTRMANSEAPQERWVF